MIQTNKHNYFFKMELLEKSIKKTVLSQCSNKTEVLRKSKKTRFTCNFDAKYLSMLQSIRNRNKPVV